MLSGKRQVQSKSEADALSEEEVFGINAHVIDHLYDFEEREQAKQEGGR